MVEQQNMDGRKAQKSPDAFRTISEVSEELEIPQHVLRFWETKFSIVKPLKRGGGRRYYRPADLEIIRGIRDLLYTHGFTIKGAQKLLKEQGGRIENIDVLMSSRPAVTPAQEPASKMSLDMSGTLLPKISGNPDPAPTDTETLGHLKDILTELREIRKLLPR